LVEERRQRGFPLHQPPHPFREAGSYLITAANFEHAAVMSSPERRTAFQEILLAGFQDIHAKIIGWVILPNHYHILANVPSLDHVSGLLKKIHGSTSREWNLQDGCTGRRKVWYHYTDRMIRDDHHMNQALMYIHYNPVKHNLVKKSDEWPWSSLLWYAHDMNQDLLKKRWSQYDPSEDFEKGWDS